MQVKQCCANCANIVTRAGGKWRCLGLHNWQNDRCAEKGEDAKFDDVWDRPQPPDSPENSSCKMPGRYGFTPQAGTVSSYGKKVVEYIKKQPEGVGRSELTRKFNLKAQEIEAVIEEVADEVRVQKDGKKSTYFYIGGK